MAMTQEEIEEFKRKARAYYGTDQLGPPGVSGGGEYEPWRDIVRDYKEKATSRYGPHKDYPGMTVNPDAFSYGDPLGLLSSMEDMDEVLGNVDYHAQLDQIDPEWRNRYTGDEPGRYGQIGPQRFSIGDPLDDMSTDGIPRGPQLGEVSRMERSLAFGGGHPDELSLAQAPQYHGYDQFTRRPPGLLDSGEGQFSQAFPGPGPDDRIVGSDQFPEWARQPAGPLAEPSSAGGGKWEDDPRFRNALAKYMMQFGNNLSQTDPFYLD